MDKKSSHAAITLSSVAPARQESIITKPNLSTIVTSGRRRRRARPIQNFTLFWLDHNIDENMASYRLSLAQLREIVVKTTLLKSVKQFMRRTRSLKCEKIFLIVSGSIGKSIIPQIHDMLQLDSIFIFCGNKLAHKTWVRRWPKVQCVSTRIDHVCTSLRRAVQKVRENTTAMSFVPKRTNGNVNSLDNLDSSFIYTMLFKEIVMGIGFNETKSVQELVSFCRDEGIPESELTYFQIKYQRKSAIWWYTCDMFLYGILNESLRDLDMEIMVKLGFIIAKLHRELQELHRRHANNFNQKFIVYRGQGMTPSDFQHLYNTNGGLLAFNSFLSTSTESKVAIRFMKENLQKCEQNIGVFFKITIDQTKVNPERTPFALIKEFSATQQENEILFSMHTVFRVNDIRQSVENKRQWNVQLTITNDNDPKLGGLAEYMKKVIVGREWYPMAKLMYTMKDFDNAEDLYYQLLENVEVDDERGHIYDMLAMIKNAQGRHHEAVRFFKISLEIYQTTLEENDPSIAGSYTNIAATYNSMSEYSKALEYYEKALKIKQESLPAMHPDLIQSYTNVAIIHYQNGDYLMAAIFFKKARKIVEKMLPSDHANISFLNSWLGRVHRDLKNYPKALNYFKKTLNIREAFLPESHELNAVTYSDIGGVHRLTGNYRKALEFHQKALQIQKNVDGNSLECATTYFNLGETHRDMKDYSTAFTYFQKSLEIRKKKLPKGHPELAAIFHNLAILYFHKGDYELAFNTVQLAVRISKQKLPSAHPYVVEYKETLEKIQKKLN